MPLFANIFNLFQKNAPEKLLLDYCKAGDLDSFKPTYEKRPSQLNQMG